MIDGVMPMSTAESIEVILVHGTFARGATWIRPAESALCRKLKDRFGDMIAFPAFQWSGSNSAWARREAAKALVTMITDLAAHEPHKRRFVVGHSHGGSVIALALKQEPMLQHICEGIIFLSTPFIQVSRGSHARTLEHIVIQVFNILGPIAAVVMTLYLAVYAGNMFRMPRFGFVFLCLVVGVLTLWLQRSSVAWLKGEKRSPWSGPLLFGPRGVAMKTFLSQFLSSSPDLVPLKKGEDLDAARARIRAQISQSDKSSLNDGQATAHSDFAPASDVDLTGFGFDMNLQRATDELVTPIHRHIARLIDSFRIQNIPASKTLIMRSDSDEASAVLAIAQFASTVSNSIVAFTARTAQIFFPHLAQYDFDPKEGGGRWGSRIRYAIVLTIGITVVLTSLTGLVIDAFRDHQWAAWIEAHLRAEGAYVALLILAVMLLSTIGYLVLMLTVGMIFGALLSIFGEWLPFAASFVQMSVEAVPPGRWTLIQFSSEDESIQWSKGKRTTLAHSKTYEEPRALECITAWITERVGWQTIANGADVAATSR